jgi:hypothetical protein
MLLPHAIHRSALLQSMSQSMGRPVFFDLSFYIYFILYVLHWGESNALLNFYHTHTHTDSHTRLTHTLPHHFHLDIPYIISSLIGRKVLQNPLLISSLLSHYTTTVRNCSPLFSSITRLNVALYNGYIFHSHQSSVGVAPRLASGAEFGKREEEF